MEKGKRILGVDFGRKRVGIAVSDPLLLMAHARETLHYRQRGELLDRLHALVEAEDIGLIVVGLPRHLSGDESDMTARVKEFVAVLQAQSSTPVITWDERLSSRQAERMLQGRDARKRRDKGAVDRGAAALILQSYLESAAFLRTTA
jgi:putative Holliday junction resolvase